MADYPVTTLTTINIGAPDPHALARFYQRLLRWDVVADEPDWVLLRPPSGGVVLPLARRVAPLRPATRPGGRARDPLAHLAGLTRDPALRGRGRCGDYTRPCRLPLPVSRSSAQCPEATAG
ncbi:MAG: hypothetical protein LC749_02930 [Actinobacteria bacterium]|nr:hypothetical protein [Actinomycetota bacterium]